MPSASWLNGWLTGDIVTAAEFRKGMGNVADSTLGAPAASIDISGLPASYSMLQVELYGRSDGASSVALWRANNDSGANYDREDLTATNAGVAASTTSGTTSGIAGKLTRFTDAANYMAATILWIPNYANTTNFKQAISVSGGLVATNMVLGVESATWKSASAINRLTLFPDVGNFATGTRLVIRAAG